VSPVRAQVVFSTWLGGPGPDKVGGAAVAADGSVILGGTMPRARDDDWKPRSRAGKGDGLVVRLSPRGDRVLSAVRLPGSVDDLDTDAEGHVYVTGSFGTARLDPEVTKVLWKAKAGGKEARVAPAPGGAAVLAGTTITVLDGHGKAKKDWTVEGAAVLDVACDGRLVFATGYSNRRGKLAGQKTLPVQVAFVRAYDLEGNDVWTAYDWPGQDVADRRLMADTRGCRLAVGPDGKLYLAGESFGGNTIWARGSRDLCEKLPMPVGDKYHRAGNTRANPIAFLARLDPRTGKAEAGTLLLARLPDNNGSAMWPRALAADEQGRVYLGGRSAVSPPVSGGAFGAGPGGGAFFCVFDRGFNRVYAARLAGGSSAAIAVGARAVVVAGEAPGELPTVAPLQARPAGDTDGWAVAFSRARAHASRSPILALSPP
jgi:hypothetical protein